MKRVATTTAYVRTWLPSVWKRALHRLLHFLLRLSMFPRRLLMLEGNNSPPPKRRWLRDAEPLSVSDGDAHAHDEEDDALFFAADIATASTSSRRGLVNSGNTCFVNAVVQCLLAIPGFVERLEEEVGCVAEAEPGGSSASEQSDQRKKRDHDAHVLLARTLLDLLKGLLPEGEADEFTCVTGENGSVTMNGASFMHRNNGSGNKQNVQDAKRSMGKKRKRPMTTSPGDYSAAATTKRLKCFLQAASKCSDLVTAEARRQDQQDAEELLLFVLDSLHQVLRWKSAPTPAQNGPIEASATSNNGVAQTTELVEIGRLVALENECLERLKKCVVTNPQTYNSTVAFLGDVRWHRFMKDNASFITEMFTGQIVRGSQCCSCANLTCLHQEFRVLSLNVDASEPSQTLDRCLEAHREMEDLVADNRVFCDEHCKDKTNRRTQVLLQRAPQVLVIQLQRFKQTGWQTRAEKNRAQVEFPINEPLDLTGNMFLRNPEEPVHYKLQAVCAHIGSSLDAGHYIAYARDIVQPSEDELTSLKSTQVRQDERWNKFDDDFVTTLDAATLHSETQSTAYMLFYTLVAPAMDTTETETEVQNQNEHGEVEINGSLQDDDNI